MKSVLILPNKEVRVNIVHQLVENPTHEVLMKAQVKLANKLIFDAIQEIQKPDRVRNNQEIQEYVKALD